MSEQDGKIVNLGGLKKFKEYYDTDIITPINNKINSKTNVQSGEIITTNNDTIGYFKNIKINGNTRYKKSDGTYTDTWESGVSLESIGEAEKNSDGKYPIEVFSCNGENLMRGTVFEKAHADYTLEDGRYTVSGDSTLNWAYVSFVIDNLVVGAEYVCSCFIESSGNKSGIVQLVDGNNKTLIFTRYAIGNVGESFIATSPTMYLRLFASNDEYNGVKRYSNVIVSKKHNKRTILLDSPLRKVGEVSDILDLDNSQITRKCKTITIDGSSDENWSYAGNNIFALQFSGYKKVDLTTNSLLICDKFTVTSHNVLNNISGNYIALESSYTNDNYIKIRKPDTTDLTTFKTSLASNPVTIVYALATPITEDIDVSSNTLTDFTTSCTLTIDNTIKGNIECNEVVGLIPSIEENSTRLANLETTLDGKAPINYVSQFEGGAISSNFRKKIIGTTDMCGFAKSFRKNDSTDACMPQYGAGIAWGQADTHGMLYVDYNNPIAYIAGGNNNKLNWSKQIAWKDDLTSYSLKTHTHDYLPLAGGNVSGNIILNNTIKISSKDKGGTVRDLIWMNNTTDGEVVVGGGSNQVTFDIPNPKSLKIWCDGTQKSYEVYHSGNLRVGGVNNIVNGGFTNGTNGYSSNNNTTITVVDESASYTGKALKLICPGSNGGIFRWVSSASDSTKTTISFYAKKDSATSSLSITFGFENIKMANASLTDEWQRFALTIDAQQGQMLIYTLGAGTFFIHSIKVESGDRYTDWNYANQELVTKKDIAVLFERNNGTINKNINTCFNSTYGEFTAPSTGQYLVMCSGYELTNSNMYIACIVGYERSNRNKLYTTGSSGFTLITLSEKETLRLYECPTGNVNNACISPMSYVNMLIAKIL